MKVLYKGLRQQSTTVELSKETLKNILKGDAYNAPVKIKHNLYLVVKIATEYGDDMYNGSVKSDYQRDPINVFEEFFIIKKGLFSYKDMSVLDYQEVEKRINEKKPMYW